MSDCPELLSAVPDKGVIPEKAVGGFVGANSFAQSAHYGRMNSQQQPIYEVETRDINKAFTGKSLYMLAAILKSAMAIPSDVAAK